MDRLATGVQAATLRDLSVEGHDVPGAVEEQRWAIPVERERSGWPRSNGYVSTGRELSGPYPPGIVGIDMKQGTKWLLVACRDRTDGVRFAATDEHDQGKQWNANTHRVP